MLEKEEIGRFITRDGENKQKKKAREGQRYYEAKHDILKYKLYYYNADGELTEDTDRNNAKISHPFFTELVDQQVQYMLSDTDNIVTSDVPELQKKLEERFNDDFYQELHELITGAVTKGYEYMAAYVDAEGKTRFECTDSLGVIEVPAKDTKSNEDHVIYYYTESTALKKENVLKIQVWDKNEIRFYVKGANGQIKEDAIPSRPHIVFKDEKGQSYGKGFGFIPFFRLDNNKKRTSNLAPIKDLIDDYDLMACSLTNNLQDFTDALYVVKGFQGNNLSEMMQNIRTKKHIGVDEGGDVEVKTIDIPYEARVAKLELDEKNIYRFGMGFNSAQVGDGNITNIVIKSRYALLDLKCNKLEIRLRQFLRKIIKVVLDEINKESEATFEENDVQLKFEREIMTNAQDNATVEKIDAEKQGVLLDNLLKVNNVIDKETIIKMICDVLDIDYEDIKEKLPQDETDIDDVQAQLDKIKVGGAVE